jgi:hypothetical protein
VSGRKTWWRRAGKGGLFARGGEDVVPVVSWGMQALDRGMTASHLATGRFAWLVGVEAAVDPVAARQEGVQPRRVGTDSRCRDEQGGPRQWCRPMPGVELQATDRVNRRFAEDDFGRYRGVRAG